MLSQESRVRDAKLQHMVVQCSSKLNEAAAGCFREAVWVVAILDQPLAE